MRYQTIELGTHDIHLCTLRDRQQFSDPTGLAASLGICSASWPLFGVVWPSSIYLAQTLLSYDTRGLRILEVGCGMALTSLLLNLLHADITATDYHPEVEQFLIRNTLLNQGAPIPYARVDWAMPETKLGKFDLIIGSDLLYEDQHVALLTSFIEAHAKPTCEVLIVDPGRGRKNKLITSLSLAGFGLALATEFPVQHDPSSKIVAIKLLRSAAPN